MGLTAPEALPDATDLWTAAGPAPAIEPAAYLGLLERQLERMPEGARLRARRFFFDLDRNTESPLCEAHLGLARSRELAIHVEFVRRALDLRFRERMLDAPRFPQPCRPFSDPETFRASLAFVSALFGRLLQVHFPGPGGAMDLAAFGRAFERFANGDLRLRLANGAAWTTQPSSGTFFYFGEFALLAAECGVERALWMPLANVFVRAQQIFCAAYPAPESVRSPTLADFTGRAYDPRARFTSAEMRALGQRFEGLDLEGLGRAATLHALLYLPGEVQGRACEAHLRAEASARILRPTWPG
jgi:hypothetical protein